MDLQQQNNDQSESLKRNLRLKIIQNHNVEKEEQQQQGNFQFLSKLFHSQDDYYEQRKTHSIMLSQSSFYYHQRYSRMSIEQQQKQDKEQQQQQYNQHNYIDNNNDDSNDDSNESSLQQQLSYLSRSKHKYRLSSKSASSILSNENNSVEKQQQNKNSQCYGIIAQSQQANVKLSYQQMKKYNSNNSYSEQVVGQVVQTQKQLVHNNKCQMLFQSLIITLITTFNPQMSTPQILCKLNPNFSIFNRILKQDNKDSILIYGVSSTGKSSSIDWALRNNKFNYQKLSIDCLEFQSQVSFIFKLNQLLKNFFEIKITLDIDYDQFTKKSLFTMLEPFIHQSNKRAVLVVENAEFLVRFTAHKVIYNLSELATNSRKNIKIILITKHPNFIKSLDRRQKSRLKLIPIQLLKYKQSIINIFQERFNYVQKQLRLNDENILQNESKEKRLNGEKIKEWLGKIYALFCLNQSFKRQLQTMSKGIENHLNAACWVIAKMLHLHKIQSSSQKELQQQMIYLYKNIMNNANSLPSKNLLQNANLDEKIFMALVYSMLTNSRKPHSFKTILRISYEFKAQKVQKAFNIYLSETNLKKAYLKLIDKKIIHFEDGENDQSDKEIKVSMNYLDIREAIINDGQTEEEELPYFVKEVLCL